MASGAAPGQPRAGAAPDRYRGGAPVSSPRTAGRLRSASFSSSSARSFAHHAPQVQGGGRQLPRHDPPR
eukprot:760123-Prymnesium_polylepis.1